MSAPGVVGVLRGHRDRGARDGGLRNVGAPRDLLGHLAAGVARREIHPRVHLRRILLQDALDDAGLAEERLPVDLREQPQDADAPLHRERRVHDEVELPLTRLPPQEQHVERLDQHLEDREAQHRRERPQLGHRERGVSLVRLDERLERRQVEVQAGRADERAGDEQDTREHVGAGVRQVAAEARGELALHLAQRTLADVVVVEEPLAGLLVPDVVGLGAGAERARGRGHGGAEGRHVGEARRQQWRAFERRVGPRQPRRELYELLPCRGNGRPLLGRRQCATVRLDSDMRPAGSPGGGGSLGGRSDERCIDGMSCTTSTGSVACASA